MSAGCPGLTGWLLHTNTCHWPWSSLKYLSFCYSVTITLSSLLLDPYSHWPKNKHSWFHPPKARKSTQRINVNSCISFLSLKGAVETFQRTQNALLLHIIDKLKESDLAFHLGNRIQQFPISKGFFSLLTQGYSPSAAKHL